jgi:LasA protease
MRIVRKVSLVSVLGALVFLGVAPAQIFGKDQAAPVSGSASQPTTVYGAGYSALWMADKDFVHGPALLDFDLKAYLAASAPALLPHAEYIAHWCGYYSISPKVLLTLIDLRSGLISSGGTTGSIADPFAGLVAAEGFEAQVQKVLTALYNDFYAFRAASAGPAASGVTINAATFALLNLFRAGVAPETFAASAEAARNGFVGRYAQLFPAGKTDVEPDASVTAVPPTTLLQLPWKVGTLWYFNGVHTNTGNDSFPPMSSIDFTRSWSQTWGADTSTDYVVASHDGTVQVFSSCSLRVTSPTGWATQYYHLSNIVVANGAQVTKNQTLSNYAGTQAQALCQGGSSTGPHVHWSLLENGQFAPVADVTVGSFLVHPGNYSYDYDQSRMWLERFGTRYYAYVHTITTPATVTNDECADAIAITSPFTHSSSTIGATTGSDPTHSCGNGSRANSVWYRYNATSTRQVVVDTVGSGYNTILAVYSGSCATLTPVTCNDDHSGTQSRVTFQSTPGTTYYVMASASTAGGGALTVNGSATSLPFTDDPLSTAVVAKAVHLTELRQRIDWARAKYGLPGFPWTEALSSGVTVRALHVAELRTALNQAYDAAKLSPPTYTDSDLVVGGTVIKVLHVSQLRAAVAAIE